MTCKTCPHPGRCCRKFRLFLADGRESTFWKSGYKSTAVGSLARQNLPFEVLRIAKTYVAKSGAYVALWYRCTKVDENGRCTIYRKRPLLCRNFKSGSDQCYQYATVKGVR